MKIEIIYSKSKNNIIGAENRLPWHSPQDMRYFKEQTMGYPVIMGWNTWESLNERYKPLPGRINIVMSRKKRNSRFYRYAASIEEALEHAAGHPKAIVIGGRQIYDLFLPMADILNISTIDMDVDGDVEGPKIDYTQWQRTMMQVKSDDQLYPEDSTRIVREIYVKKLIPVQQTERC